MQTDSNAHNRTIFKNMAVYATGTGFAKLIGFISIPIITRIYSPEDLGVLSVFIALSVLLVPFGTMRYSIALPLPKQDAVASNLAVLCFSTLLFMTLLSTFILWMVAEPVLELLSMQAIIEYWWILPIVLFGAGIYEILSGWATREKAFKTLAKTKVHQAFMGAITKISLGLLGIMPMGLLIGQMVGQVSGVLSLSRIFFTKFKFRDIKKARVIFLLNRYVDFPKYRLPSELLLVFSMQAPLLFSAFIFGAEITGQIGLALMAMGLPIALIGFTTGQAYYAEIAKIGQKEPKKIYQITKDITKTMFLFSLVPFLILVFFGPWLFQFVFGSEWQQAGLFASLLSVYLLTQFISSPLINALTVFDKQKLFLFINIRRVLLVLIVFTVSFAFSLSVVYTLLLYSILLALHYLLVTVKVFRVINAQIV